MLHTSVLSVGAASPQRTRPKSNNLRVEQHIPVERVRRGPVAFDLSDSGEWPEGSPDGASPASSAGLHVSDSLSSSHPLASPVLVFSAYHCESVPEASEVVRSRDVIIKYFTEDDTLALHEPRVTNSGLPQGKTLKRMRIPIAAMQLPATGFVGIMPPLRTSGSDIRAAVPGVHLTWRDLTVGEELTLFGRRMRIAACDLRTRRWYESQGQPQPGDLAVFTAKPHHMAAASSPVPGGPPVGAAVPAPFYGKRVNPEKRFLEASRGSTSVVMTRGIADKTAQYRAHDPHATLRFKGVFDDRARPFGDVVHYDVLYYLADDNMEIVEIRTPNDGRESMCRLWRKNMLPRTVIYHDSRGRDIEDGGGEEDYYSAADLAVGTTINVLARPILLYDADKATYAYYSENFGLDMQKVEAPTRDTQPSRSVIIVPPHMGYGTEEDSLASLALQPMPPRKDWAKLKLYDGVVLRFHATFAAPRTIPDQDRKFTLSYFPATDSVAVYEPKSANSGFAQGHFISKMRLRNPATGVFYKAADFCIGGTVDLNSHVFRLDSVDPETAALLLDMGLPSAA